MVGATAVGTAAGPRHIIRRPRLTKQLDESGARIVLLVAPAGYGKTTLAAEWLGSPERRAAWYRGGPAAADVAALAAGIARTAAEIVPGAGDRLRERLRVTSQPDSEVDVLAELLVEDVVDWPDDAWLALDDYQFAIDSPASEQFVESVLIQSPLRVLITSRRRPTWVSARSVLYGDVFELDRRALAMNDGEARQVLARHRGGDVDSLVARAKGWPAVIGLAALTGELRLPDEELPAALYDYFAEELYQTAEPTVRWGLCQLAVAPLITLDLAEFLFGAETGALILEHGVRLGVITRGAGGRLDLHPLLRSFLAAKFDERGDEATRRVVDELGRFYLGRGDWDAVFALVERFADRALLVELVEAALQELLTEGRLSTLSRWLEYADGHCINSPILDLAEAEVALLQGQYARAKALALQSARRLTEGHLLVSRAFGTAGRSAHLDNRHDEALTYHAEARRLASTDDDARNAVWGKFVACVQVERPDAPAALVEFRAITSESADDLLRVATGELILATRSGHLLEVQRLIRATLHLLPKARDPLIRSSFINSYTYALAISAHYADAATAVLQELREADRYRLRFVPPFAWIVQAMTQIGLRRFRQASQTITQIHHAAVEHDDPFLEASSCALRARLLISHGDLPAAVEAARSPHGTTFSPGVNGEVLASRALALACDGQDQLALETLQQARDASRLAEVRTLAILARAVAFATADNSSAERAIDHALTRVASTGMFDSFVCAYRGYPQLLGYAKRHKLAPTLADVLVRANDLTLAAAYRLPVGASNTRDPAERLTPRELEVFHLLEQGLANKEIASQLYLSPSTVKAHLRSIFRKLGVQSRTEAVARAKTI